MFIPEFEWDRAKATTNIVRHGVSFETAATAFDDPSFIDRIDDRDAYGEERWILIGMTAAGLLVVVHTQRGDRVRIISARYATRRELKDYERQTSD